MKNIRIIKNAIGSGTILALIVGFGSSAFAGPSPQFWAQQERNRADIASRQQAAKPADKQAMTCPTCQTTAIRVFHPSGFDGKVPSYYEPVGKKHTCAHCGMGSITVVDGVKTNSMTRGCSMCGEDVALCTKAVPPPPAKT